MDPARWQSAKQLLADVVDLPPAAQRAHIEAHCSDLTLRRELLSMLASPASVSAVLKGAALKAGDQMGAYEIVEPIGAGGMGEVYRARDTTLGRDVAIKVLPQLATLDRDRVSRFERESRLLASLNHPHIAHVYGVEEVNGTRALVMELVPGPTLADRIAKGPLPIKEVLAIARQIAEAIAAAHERQIIHRDLKPANIKVRDDGTVKVLDFGLAKALTPAGTEDALISPTVSGCATRADVVLGTAAYMSPEQAAGKPADRRSDLWAFGVVLFEMLTRRRAFAGESVSHVLAAVLQSEPEWRALPSATPPQIISLLRRCLTKDPRQRLDSAAAARLEIEEAAENSSRRVSVTSGSRGSLKSVSFAVAVTAVLVSAGLWTARGVWLSAAFPFRRVVVPIPGNQAYVDPAVAFHARDWVLVTTFENRTGDRQLDKVVEHALEYQLSQSSYVNVVPADRVEDALRLMARPSDTVVTAGVGREIAVRDGGIRIVIDGAVDRVGSGYAMTVTVVDPQNGAIVASDREEVRSRDGIQAAVGRLAVWVRTSVGESPVSVKQDADRMEHVTTPSLEATRLFTDGLRAFNSGRFPEAEVLFQSALANDATFAAAHIWLAWTRVNAKKRPEEYLPSAQRAMDLSGTVSEREREWIAGSYYVLNHRDEQAQGVFEAMVRRYPDDFWAVRNLIDIYGRTGRQSAILPMTARVADLQPTNFRVQAQTASSFLQLLGVGAARPFIARATRSMPAAEDNPGVWTTRAKIWTLLFPAHDLWTRGRAAEAAAVVDSAAKRPELGIDRSWAVALVGMMRLALGQVRRAEATLKEIDEPGLRSLMLADAAWARRDRAGMLAQLNATHMNDFSPVSLYIRAGDLDAAARFLPTVISPTPNSASAVWSADEIEEARGNAHRIDAALAHGVPWTAAMTGARTFMYSETLARAAAAKGNRAAAIKILEDTAPVGDRAFVFFTHSGFFWMQDQKLLADLYREAGEIQKARTIEADLMMRLAAADPDYPLLLDLKKRGG